MNIDQLKPEFEMALVAKLQELALLFSRKSIARIDIGVFPWHGAIELSILLVEDDCDANEIAAWPNYNISSMYEGKWPEVENVCKKMQRMWETDVTSSISFFQAVGEIVKSSQVASMIQGLPRSPTFQVTLLDPDNKKSVNYCA
jgi:hypothetical protein